MNFGVEGESYNMVDGKPVYTDQIFNNPEGLSIAEALSMYCRATVPAPGLKQAPEYLERSFLEKAIMKDSDMPSVLKFTPLCLWLQQHWYCFSLAERS